jgi:hypothetical protein
MCERLETQPGLGTATNRDRPYGLRFLAIGNIVSEDLNEFTCIWNCHS